MNTKPVPTPSYLQQLVGESARILLLQGPIGFFFQNFARWLQQDHKKLVFKINFNAGDESFYPNSLPNTFSFNNVFQVFPQFLSAFLQEHQIDAIVCFGDTRPYHSVAKKIAAEQGISFWAFEEGYFRPFYITLEKQGVNAYSPLPRQAEFFQQALPQLATKIYSPPQPVQGGFLPVAKLAIRYYLVASLYRQQYPFYIHHRITDLKHYINLWARSGLKRAIYVLRDRYVAQNVRNGKYGKFFILPLQVFNDSQIRVHSDFSSVRNFLLHVLSSFAAHAPEDVSLIVKHHPMDRGFIDYQKDINKFIKEHPKLKGRITYIHDVPLPVFLKHGIGMVTLNSTSGLSALIHQMPVKVMGRAHYDIPEITDQQSLAEFWQHPQRPNPELFNAYRMYHINMTQINGSFYSQVNFPIF